jgi:hypothetical protein
MPKLLSQEDARMIVAAMAKEYGLTATVDDESVYSNHDGLYTSNTWVIWIKLYRTLEVRTSIFLPKRFTRVINLKLQELQAGTYEEGIQRLEHELNKLNQRAKVAESYREKYAMKEAAEALDEVLSEKTTI